MEPIIYVKKLSKKFGDFIAVNEIDFDVYKGEIFAFLGPNGAGKSTTIKMLTTLLSPTSGSLFLAGFDVTRE
ncbi:MAG TPA: ATP-binding cassette domain-containing protein, partial [Bacteroidia bacterium]|nr:ATP-binding cassette domain-containing protein [Bacteroidia bacterium]